MMTGPYQPGDMALVHESGFVETGIQFGTRSRYNHVRLIVSPHGAVVEARPRGASRGHVSPGDVVVRPPLTLAQRLQIPDIAAGLLGTPYGFLDVAALGLAQFGITLPGVKRRIARPDRLFCSQLCDYAWSLAGFTAFTDGRTPQDVSPGDLADLAFRDGWELVKHG
jgi:hypothetical protein